MRLTVNGKAAEAAEGTTLEQYVRGRGLDPATVVVELNRAIVPQDGWGAVVLRENDSMELLSFVGGG